MSRFTKTLIEGTLALGSLYLVARLGFKVGYDTAKAEDKISEAEQSATGLWTPVESPTPKKGRMKIFDTLFKGKEIHVSVKPTKPA